jgi:hypothetical protein
VDADAILAIKPSRRGIDDVIAWMLEKSGVFFASSAYKLGVSELPAQTNFASSSAQPGGDDICWRNIWSANVPPKVKNFAWKAASEALATECNKRQRHILVTGTCMICGMEEEDTRHALFRCTHAANLWSCM